MRNNKFTFEVDLIFAVTTNTSMQIVCCSMELLTFHSSCGVEKFPFYIHGWIQIMCKWQNLHFILKKYTSVVFVSSDMPLTTECFFETSSSKSCTGKCLFFMYPVTAVWASGKPKKESNIIKHG